MKSITIKLKLETVQKLFPHIFKSSNPDEELALFRSGAKLYKSRRPGDWRISGYAHDGHDVLNALDEIIKIM